MGNNSKKKESSLKSKLSSSTPTKSHLIRELLLQGKGATEITRLLKCSRTMVYKIKDQLASESPRVKLSDLPFYVVKAADFFRTGNQDLEMSKGNCLHCGREMWVHDPKKNDLCEDCAIQIMHEAGDAQVKRDIEAFVDPFSQRIDLRTDITIFADPEGVA
jgi:hypothetical protein